MKNIISILLLMSVLTYGEELSQLKAKVEIKDNKIVEFSPLAKTKLRCSHYSRLTLSMQMRIIFLSGAKSCDPPFLSITSYLLSIKRTSLWF